MNYDIPLLSFFPMTSATSATKKSFCFAFARNLAICLTARRTRDQGGGRGDRLPRAIRRNKDREVIDLTDDWLPRLMPGNRHVVYVAAEHMSRWNILNILSSLTQHVHSEKRRF